MLDLSFDRRAAIQGAKRVFPLVIPGIPFGMVLGFLITDANIDPWAGWSTSWIIFAGSSQLVAMNLIADGASAVVIVTSVVLINSRHAMYSAALKDRFSIFPLWFRLIGPYFLIDQQFAVADTAPELVDPTPRYRMWHFMGAGWVVWTLWVISVALGIFVGDIVREEWSLSFAVPLLFLGLMVLSVRDRPGILAALVASTIAVVGRDLPQGSSLLLAIIAGVAVAAFAETRIVATT